MELLKPDSLAATIDAINAAFFFGEKIPKTERGKAAKWIAGRFDQPRSYLGLPAPTDKDYREGVKVFSGEAIKSGAATGHILGEEACRALVLLKISTPEIRRTLEHSQNWIKGFLDWPDRRKGTYCCGTCTPAYWRYLSVSEIKNADRELNAGIKYLKDLRDGNGKWRRFPFYYTLLALSDLEIPSAVREIRYTEPILERLLLRSPKKGDKYSERRHTLVNKILNKFC